ncbi:MAG: hypothetical protein FWG87_02045 [Defluviitaleaceae bacterium]|nr:hypothetical protein [Defluviitaleaceae bacterium]
MIIFILIASFYLLIVMHLFIKEDYSMLRIFFVGTLFVVTFFAMLFGIIVHNRVLIEDVKIKKQRHIEEITSALQFEIAPHETLEVQRFYKGGKDTGLSLYIRIGGVQSVDDFISRLRGNIHEIDSTNEYNPYFPYHDILSEYAIDRFAPFTDSFGRVRSIQSTLMFFSDRDEIYSLFVLNVPSGAPLPWELGTAIDILNEYFPSILLNPFFIVPFLILVASTVFLIIYIIHRRKYGY